MSASAPPARATCEGWEKTAPVSPAAPARIVAQVGPGAVRGGALGTRPELSTPARCCCGCVFSL